MAANPNAVWTKLILLTQTVIQGLNLVYGSTGTALPNSQVYDWKIATDGYRLPTITNVPVVQFPCVQCVLGRLEDVADAMQDFEDTVLIYPVVVAILFASNHALAINNDLLYWRQQIYNAFVDYPDSLRAAAEAAITDANVFDCRITTQPVLDTSMWQKENLDFSWLVLNYATTVSRGRS